MRTETGIAVRYKDDPQAYMRAYYEKTREKQLAAGKIRGAKWRAENIDYKREKSRAVCASRKASVINLYGGMCCKCGYSDARALQLDHINGSPVPNADRTRAGEAGEKLYRRILDGLTDRGLYQLLCANCNWIKRAEAGECRRKT